MLSVAKRSAAGFRTQCSARFVGEILLRQLRDRDDTIEWANQRRGGDRPAGFFKGAISAEALNRAAFQYQLDFRSLLVTNLFNLALRRLAALR